MSRRRTTSKLASMTDDSDARPPRESVNGAVDIMSYPPLPADYRPSEDEEFMNPVMQEYFRQKLARWRAELLRDSSDTLQSLQEESLQEADIADRATLETDRSIELRTRDRERKLIAKINQALARIEAGTYGYCEETGDPISVKRLDARPIAMLSLDAQERHEREERTQRED